MTKLEFNLDKLHRLYCYVKIQYIDDKLQECWIPLEYAIKDKIITTQGKSATVIKVLHTFPLKEGQILVNDIDAIIITD